MKGVYTALITPFEANGKIDREAFRRLLRDQRDAGIAGVIPCGTTGESPTLSTEEKKTLIQIALEELQGSQTRVIAGTGGNVTQETAELSAWASQQGVAGVLVVTPYYNKPTPAGLLLHYKTIADSVSCEVILYNVPGRTGVSLTPETIVELAKHPRIRTIKEATGNVAFGSEVLDATRKAGVQLDVLSGDDATYFPLCAVGGVGVVSVASNLFPRAMVTLQKAVDAGDWSHARGLHQKYYPAFRDLFLESNPGPIKWAMKRAGLCDYILRAPLAPLTEASAKRLEATLTGCGLKAGSLF